MGSPINWIKSGEGSFEGTGIFPRTKSMPAISEEAVNLYFK